MLAIVIVRVKFLKTMQITDDTEKRNSTRYVLEALPDWFGIPEAREEYIQDSEGKK